MSKLSEFTEHLATIKPGQQATLSYDGCLWLIGEIARIQNAAKTAIIEKNAAEQLNRQLSHINNISDNACRGISRAE